MIKRKIKWVDFSETLGLYPWRIFKHSSVLVIELPDPILSRKLELYSDHENDIKNWLKKLS